MMSLVSYTGGLFLAATVFILGRANGFRALSAFGLAACASLLPMTLLFLLLINPLAAPIVLAGETVATLTLPVVVFALAMAVSKKVRGNG